MQNNKIGSHRLMDLKRTLDMMVSTDRITKKESLEILEKAGLRISADGNNFVDEEGALYNFDI
jgi:hypothetical protein